MVKEQPARKPYPSDLPDAPWTLLEPLLPTAHTPRAGRPREVDRRDIVQTLWYLKRRGCQEERLPHDVLPKSPVYDDCARWRDDGPGGRLLEALRAQTRRHVGREPTPRAACLDSPSGKTTAMGGAARGSDGGQQVKGRTRHLVVNTLGLWIVVLITSAGLAEGVAAPQRLQRMEPNDVPRLATICADHTYHHHALHTWMSDHRPTWCLEVKTRPEGSKGVTPLEKRGVVARINAWTGRSRRHRQDDERPPESSAAMRSLSNMQLMRRRLTSHRRPAFHDRSVTTDSLNLASCISG